MTAVIQYILYLVILVALAVPLGAYIKKVMNGEKTFLSRVLTPCENLVYKVMRVNRDEQMNWKQYTASVLIFSGIGLVFLFLLQILQGVLPGNPQGLPGVKWDLSFNTASSFVTNTNWQAYSGESTLSYLSQSLGLTVQNFVSAATGIAVLFALIRGFIQVKTSGLGSFWVDMTRIIIHILIPLNLVISLLLVGGGVIQNLKGAETVSLVEPVAVSADGEILDGAVIDEDAGTVTVDGILVPDAEIVTEQFVPMGPAASQVAIKQSGTNGGGFNGVNSAHPLENPNAFTNLIEMISILLIPAALCFTFGSAVKNKKARCGHICGDVYLPVRCPWMYRSQRTSRYSAACTGRRSQYDHDRSGRRKYGGKRDPLRHCGFLYLGGIYHSSLQRLRQLHARQLYTAWRNDHHAADAAWRGDLRRHWLRSVWNAGICHPDSVYCRTDGGQDTRVSWKKIEPFEMKWAVLVCLATPIGILVGSGIAALVPSVMDSLNNGGTHGFSEMLYAYSSAGGNNGSAFAGFNANTVFLNVSIGLVMLFVRFLPVVGTLAIAGSLAQKKKIAATAGTLSTTNAMFVFLLIFVVLLIGRTQLFPGAGAWPAC